MKYIYLSLVALSLSFLSVHAQDLEFEPSFSVVDGITLDYDITLHSFVKNNTTGPISLEWFRNIEDKPGGWEAAVCDLNQCYPPNIYTMPFDLSASSSGLIDVHFYTDSTVGYAWTEILIREVGNAANAVTGYYYCSGTYDFVMNRLDLSDPLDHVSDSAHTSSFLVNVEPNAEDYVLEIINDTIPTNWTLMASVDGQALAVGTPVTVSLDSFERVEILADFIANGDLAPVQGRFDLRVYRQGNAAGADTLTFLATNFASSVNEKANKNMLIFPNPATNLLNLNVSGFKPGKAEVHNLLGKQVATWDLSGNSQSAFDVSGFAEGLYFIKIADTDGLHLMTQSFKKTK